MVLATYFFRMAAVAPVVAIAVLAQGGGFELCAGSCVCETFPDPVAPCVRFSADEDGDAGTTWLLPDLHKKDEPVFDYTPVHLSPTLAVSGAPCGVFVVTWECGTDRTLVVETAMHVVAGQPQLSNFKSLVGPSSASSAVFPMMFNAVDPRGAVFLVCVGAIDDSALHAVPLGTEDSVLVPFHGPVGPGVICQRESLSQLTVCNAGNTPPTQLTVNDSHPVVSAVSGRLRITTPDRIVTLETSTPPSWPGLLGALCGVLTFAMLRSCALLHRAVTSPQ